MDLKQYVYCFFGNKFGLTCGTDQSQNKESGTSRFLIV